MTAAIILAAGASTRLGQPKQNLLFIGQTLLQTAISAAGGAGCEPVIVVLGANARQIEAPQADLVLYNPAWQEGMSSSIRLGVEALKNYPAVTGAFLLLCDQPFVNAGLLDQLIRTWKKTKKKITACAYNGTTGVPVLFDQAFFSDLLRLSGQEGAKKLINAHGGQTALVPFGPGEVDIDTPEDYQALLGQAPDR